MVLLEVLDRRSVGEPSFLCECSVRSTVRAVAAHVNRLSRLREQLAIALAKAKDSDEVGTKRGRAAADFAEANALLSPTALQKKEVLTSERLEAALVSLCSGKPSAAQADVTITEQADDVDGTIVDAGEGSTGSAVANTAADSCAIEGPASLYFAGRMLEGLRPLSEYVGTNEKSKVRVAYGEPAAMPETDLKLASDHPLEDARVPPSTIDLHAEPQGGAGDDMIDEISPTSATGGVSLMSFFKRARGGGEEATADGEIEENGEEDADAPLLSAAQAAMLMESSEVRSALKDQRLQVVLRHVDSAGTREVALRRLEEALEDPNFEEFSLTTLRAIGWRPASGEDL